MDLSREQAVELNKKEYGEDYALLRWVTDEEALKAAEERERILSSLAGSVQFGFHGTKLDCRELSPGCTLCGEGLWSCLFVNSLCNARCFYCPSEQRSKSEPITNGILFSNPQDYTDYLEKFQIKGASLSGGEPFLTFERTLLFLRKIKGRFGSKVYLWLYTNGSAADQDHLEALKAAGLDEIRFDLSASRYDLRKVSLAANILNTVTVEIPAIPEDFERLKSLVLELRDRRIRFLNLHQLRCTPHNLTHLARRGYRFLHGAKVTVLESELTALRLLEFVTRHSIELPVNYCSFAYKNRFQTIGHRRRFAPFVLKPFEEVTPVGAIRRITVQSPSERIEALVRTFKTHGCPESSWESHDQGRKISFHPDLLPHVDRDLYPLRVSYHVPALVPGVSYQNAFKEIPLNRRKSVFIEKQPVLQERELKRDELLLLRELLERKGGLDSAAVEQKVGFQDILQWEYLESGLPPYF
jgi:pyruvate formate-lyase activating enzyme-like uncharacterized protein